MPEITVHPLGRQTTLSEAAAEYLAYEVDPSNIEQCRGIFAMLGLADEGAYWAESVKSILFLTKKFQAAERSDVDDAERTSIRLKAACAHADIAWKPIQAVIESCRSAHLDKQ